MIESIFIFQNFQESISSIQGGCVGTTGYTEIVICTFSGLIFGLTTQCLKISLSDNLIKTSTNYNNSVAAGTDYMKTKITKLKSEIHELELKVAKERERYQLSTQSHSIGISAIPMLPVNDSVGIIFFYDISLLIIQYNF